MPYPHLYSHPHWYILFFYFLATHPNFMKFRNFPQNLSAINILDIFFQN